MKSINKINKTVLTLILLLNCTFSVFAQNWPFLAIPDPNNPNTMIYDRGIIGGTPGEIRTNSSTNPTHCRFHGGVDMTNPNPATGTTSVDVYSVSDGQITWEPEAVVPVPYSALDAWNSIITIGDRQYKHVHLLMNGNSPAFVSGSTVAANTKIGTMFPSIGNFSQHVHLNGDPSSTDVYDLFSPFSDVAAAGNNNGHLPVFYNWMAQAWVTQDNSNVLRFYTDGVSFSRDETTHAQTTKRFGTPNMPPDIIIPAKIGPSNTNFPATTHKVVFGSLDVVARVKDAGINENGTANAGYNNAPHIIQYRFCKQPRILNYNCNNAYQEFSLHNIPANNVVPPTATTNSDYTFLKGSNYAGGNNQYIITNRNNADDKWEPGQNGPEGDGRYVIGVHAHDIVNQSVEHFVPVIVDNFKPYIRQLEILQDGQQVTQSSWIYDAASGTVAFNSTTSGSTVGGTGSIQLILHSSEPLLSESLNVTLQPNAPLVAVTTSSPSTVNDLETEFVFDLSISNVAIVH